MFMIMVSVKECGHEPVGSGAAELVWYPKKVSVDNYINCLLYFYFAVSCTV
jgi:hypothetical protein